MTTKETLCKLIVRNIHTLELLERQFTSSAKDSSDSETSTSNDQSTNSSDAETSASSDQSTDSSDAEIRLFVDPSAEHLMAKLEEEDQSF
ncbi:hypothetical protein SIIN_4901_T [Serendipita indica DSM 11827]|nr:hypothetical protein SIIN_4901_T [Serendipita indica DSM 11827]